MRNTEVGFIEPQVTVMCKLCKSTINGNTHKKMTYCACDTIAVDGCEYYVRVIGEKEDYTITPE